MCVKDTGEVSTPEETAGEPDTQEPAATPDEPVAVADEPVGPEDAGPPETPGDKGPDTPARNCPYGKAQEVLTCPLQDYNCDRLSKPFKRSNVTLPVPISGAAATTNYKTRNKFGLGLNNKWNVYLIGGGDNTAGVDVYYAEVNGDDGTIVEWKKTSVLNDARRNAKAFYIDDVIYVGGGVDALGKAVLSFESAKVNADGSLENFQKIGNWNDARPRAGLTYRYGYFYLVGGVNSDDSLSKSVERVLLQPDGRLGRFEKLTELDEGRTGPLVATQRFLYLLGPNGSSKVLLSQILDDGKLGDWCANNPLPQSAISELQAVGDVRRVITFGYQKTNKTIDNRVFLATLEEGTDKNVLGGGLNSWRCSDHKDDTTRALVLTPRVQAAGLVVDSLLFLFGGQDGGGKALDSVEFSVLHYRETQQCDLDRDKVSGSFDFCPAVYAPGNDSTDQPSGIQRPGQTGWIEAFGLGNVCESEAMLLVPAGSFRRGSSGAQAQPDAPVRDVELKGFYIDDKEVTNGDYQECVKLGKCDAPKRTSAGSVTDYYGNAQYKDFPVVHVTWEMAKKYCEFRGKRLPTEAEWEKAARGLGGGVYPWGNVAPTCAKDQELANYKDCTTQNTQEVGKFAAGKSPFGAFDMAGNVREWVADYYGEKYYETDASLKDPTGPDSGTERVVRGGSFSSDANGLLVHTRDKLSPSSDAADLGFRCAQTLFLPIKAID